MKGTRAYLDVVSTSPPDRANGREWRGHPMRVSIALEEGAQITAQMNMQVKPLARWPIDPAWCRRYGANAGHALESGHPIREVAESAKALLEIADVIVAHSAAFHTGVIANMLVEAGLAATYSRDALGAVYDTQTQTAQDCAIPLKTRGGFKQPRLPEALEHFTGERLPDIADAAVPWWQAGLIQMTSLRRVFWAKQRAGLAPMIDPPGAVVSPG